MESENKKWINEEWHTKTTMYERYKGLVHLVIKRDLNWGYRLGYDYEDMVSIGNIGLLNAFDRFDGDNHSVKFSTYAYTSIRNEVHSFFRSTNPGFRYTPAVKELRKEIFKKELEFQSIEIITKTLARDRKEVAEALHLHQNEYLESLDEIDSSDLEEFHFLGKNDDQTKMLAEEFLKTLSSREKYVVQEVMLGKSQHEIGRVLGINQATVSKILIFNVRKKHEEFYKEKLIDKLTINEIIQQHETEILEKIKSKKPKEVKEKKKQDKVGKIKINGKKPMGDVLRAKELLIEGNLSVLEIAEMTGTNRNTLKVYKRKLKQAQMISS